MEADLKRKFILYIYFFFGFLERSVSGPWARPGAPLGGRWSWLVPAVAGKTLFVATPRAWWAPRGIARARSRSGDPIGTSKTKDHPRDASPVPSRPPAGARAPCAHPKKKHIYIQRFLLNFRQHELNDSVKEDDSVERKRDSSRDCSRRNFVDEATIRSE